MFLFLKRGEIMEYNQLNLFDSNTDYYDGSNDLIDINNLNFRVHASIIYKLGESLIADEVTALSELIKNSYDADASFCKLAIDSNYIDENGNIGKIEITDNGSGMDLPTIVNGWLTISNSVKKKMKKENKTTTKFSRIPLGEKGLGRLSVQKLGSTVTLETKTAEANSSIRLTIPWEEFLKNTTLDRIPLNCEHIEYNNNKSFTSITITGLINPQFWTSNEVKKDLEKTINKIISPFRFNESSNFIISATIDDYKIDINNTIFNDILKTSRSEYYFEVLRDTIRISCRLKIDFFKKRNIYKDYEWFDYNIDYFVEMHSMLTSKFDNAALLNDGRYIYELKFEIPLNSMAKLKRNSLGELYNQGIFDGKIYDFSYDSTYISELIQNYDFVYALKENEYKEYIKLNNGIKVIRDGFVVQGYGDGAIDWLKLSSQATTSGKYGNIRNDNVIGYIRLSGLENQSLKETTSREGFINDEYYQNFYDIIRDGIIKKINNTNEIVTNVFKEYLRTLSTEASPELEFPVDNVKNIADRADTISSEIKSFSSSIHSKIHEKKQIAKATQDQPSFFTNDKLYSELNDIIKLQDKMITELEEKTMVLFNDIRDVKKSAVIIEDDFQKFNRRISDVFELAGLGISVELFTHELYTTINNVNEKIIRINHSNDELKYIANSMNTLRKQISYFHPGLKFVRMKKDSFTLTEFVEAHTDFYKHQALAKNINFNVIDESSGIQVTTNRGMLNQVLDNLFSNSIYWLTYSRDNIKYIDICEYNIKVNNNYTIDIWDNGIGISQDIENELFNPFISRKESGRGLGLFICKQNLENNGATIRLIRERNQFHNLYKFKVDLSGLRSKEVE